MYEVGIFHGRMFSCARTDLRAHRDSVCHASVLARDFALEFIRFRAPIVWPLHFGIRKSDFACGRRNNFDYLLAAAIVLSWGGMRGIAGLSWALVLGSVVIRATDTADAMGPFGFVMVLSAFVGLLLHSQLSPAQLFAEIIREFRPAPQLDNANSSADLLRSEASTAETTTR